MYFLSIYTKFCLQQADILYTGKEMIMNRSSSKKALIASAAAMSLSAVLFAGTTFAWFTDSAKSGISTIQSGNLDINLYQLNTQTSTYSAVTSDTAVFADNSVWEPGAVEVVYLKAENAGSLALQYQLSFPVLQNITGTSVTGAAIDLTSVLKASVVELKEGEVFASRSDALTAAKSGTAVSIGSYNVLSGTLNSKQNSCFAVVLYMPESTGNEANYAGNAVPSLKLGISISAAQTPYENDSFNEQYDREAGFPVASSGFAGLLETGGNLALTEDITIESEYTSSGSIIPQVITIADNSVLDLQGNTITNDNFGLILQGNNVTVQNGTLEAVKVYNSDSYAIFIGDEGETNNFTIQNVTMKGGINLYNAYDVILKNCDIQGNSYWTIWAEENATVVVESGIYKAGRSGLIATDGTASVIVKGGTFNADPSAYTAKGYTVVEENGWYTVVPAENN